MIARTIWFLALSISLSAIGSERILSFNSEVTVQANGALDVHETITVLSKQESIRHGIMREFPTKYKDRFNNGYNVGFELHHTLLDGQTVAVREEHRDNGVVLYLGDADTLLDIGKHTYEITYSTTRQVGFYKDFDEIYWNVTGNGWRFPIDAVKATIILPAGATKSSLKIAGYTGFSGETGKDFSSSVNQTNNTPEVHSVIFTSSRPLRESEGLTVAVGWQKGLVAQPSFAENAAWFLKDNLGVWFLLVGLIAISFLYGRVYLRTLKSNRPGAIIPLFTPPQNWLPSEVRYLSRTRYDAQVLSSEIVNLAVMGYLTINYKSGFFKGKYSVIGTEKSRDNLAPIQRTILNLLFGNSVSEHQLGSGEDRILIEIVKLVQNHLKSEIASGNFVKNAGTLALCIALSAISVIGGFIWEQNPGVMFFVFVGVIVVVNLVFSQALTAYTKQGRQLMDQIDGFKLFLATTETERLTIIGTPPTRTPELYEKYLPFAMALGVETQWAKQFTPVFNILEQQQTPYYPIWYVGPPGTHFQASRLSHDLTSSFKSAISSSSQAPGTSSGSSGGGSSGGGGGGGGGGGW